MTVANKTSVLGDVRALVEATIGIAADRLDIDAEWADLGIDSIIAMELMERLGGHFGITFTPAQFLAVNSVRELAAWLEREAAPVDEAAAAPVPAVAPAAAPAADPLRSLADSVRRAWAIELPASPWQSVDQMVDAIVANHLDQAVQRYGDAGLREPAAAPVRSGDVAIVGLACRFPDAPDAPSFWRNLLERRCSIREVPASRWDWQDHWAPAAAPGKTVSKWAALLDDVDRFDPQFFGLSPQEARLIDPQERLLMQEAYHALQDAGIDPGRLAGSNTGVFVGYEYAEYEQYLRRHQADIPGLVCSSSSPTYYLANRLSFSFDLRGPSESVNVNCASSAVAIHRACLSLAQGESELALAGAAHLNLFAGDYVTASQYGLLSSDGSCGVFDNAAGGFTRGEGVGVLVLKRLDAALADGDRVYAVIKASHQANRGAAASLSEVKHEAITALIERCHEKAGLDDGIDYLELNGYAKKWADSFEFEGIRNALKPGSRRCALGSLKGNIGHLEPVNGIASVIKLALALHHQRFPASLTRRVPSSFIDFGATAASPLYFADAEIDFAAIRRDAQTPVRAGVSSFADSGVNVHLVLEEWLPRTPQQSAPPAAGPQLFVLSARDRQRLAEHVESFIAFLAAAQPAPAFADLVHTLQCGREAMAARLAVVASSADELHDKLCLLKESGIGGRSKLEAMGIFLGDVAADGDAALGALVTPEMAASQLALSLQAGAWEPVGRLWVHGVALPWAQAWAGRGAQRVSLPGYPFAKERCWVDIGAELVVASAVTATRPAPVAMVATAPTPASEPAGRIELFLRQQLAALLQRPLAEIDADANVALLGIGSIGIAELVGRTSQLLQVPLAPTVVFQHPQLRALARHLAQSHPDRAVPAPGILVPMQVRGSATPLVLVPGADGSVLSLKLLCEALGDRQPLYGLDAVGLDGALPLPSSVEEVAQLNLAALRTVQPQGPYRLLGYSNGGVVAFEMARALRAQGQQVESLTLLDSLCPTARTSTELDLVAAVFSHQVGRLGGSFDLDLDHLAQVSRGERGQHLHRLLGEHGLALPRDAFLATYDVATASEAMCRAYGMPVLPGGIDVCLVRASAGFPGAPADYGWNRHLAQPLRVLEVDANHFTVIEAGAVARVAELIGMPAAARPKPAPKSRRKSGSPLALT